MNRYWINPITAIACSSGNLSIIPHFLILSLVHGSSSTITKNIELDPQGNQTACFSSSLASSQAPAQYSNLSSGSNLDLTTTSTDPSLGFEKEYSLVRNSLFVNFCSLCLLVFFEPLLSIALAPFIFSISKIRDRISIFILFSFISFYFINPFPTLPVPGSCLWYLEMQVLPPFRSFFTYSIILSNIIPIGVLFYVPFYNNNTNTPSMLPIIIIIILIQPIYSSLSDIILRVIIIPLLIPSDSYPNNLLLLQTLILTASMTIIALPPLANAWLVFGTISPNPYFAFTLLLTAIRFVMVLVLLRSSKIKTN